MVAPTIHIMESGEFKKLLEETTHEYFGYLYGIQVQEPEEADSPCPTLVALLKNVLGFLRNQKSYLLTKVMIITYL